MTREEIIVAIEAAEHALEHAYFNFTVKALKIEIERLSHQLRALDGDRGGGFWGN